MAKTAGDNKKSIFNSKLDVNLSKGLVKCYSWSIAVWCCKLDTAESRSEIPWKL